MESMECEDKLMTLDEVAAMMRINTRKVRTLIRSGDIAPVVRMTDVRLTERGTFVRASVVQRAIRNREGEGHAPQNRVARIPSRQRI